MARQVMYHQVSGGNHPQFTLGGFSQLCADFDTNISPHLTEMEAKRSELSNTLDQSSRDYTSVLDGIGADWSSPTGVRVKDTLQNVIIEGVNRVKTSVDGSFVSLLSKLTDISTQIAEVKDFIQNTNTTLKYDKLDITKYIETTTGATSVVDNSQTFDTAEISRRETEIRRQLQSLETSIRGVASAVSADGGSTSSESLGIIGNVCNGGTLGSVTAMDLESVTVPNCASAFSALQTSSGANNGNNVPQEGNTIQFSLNSVNDINTNLDSYLSYLETRPNSSDGVAQFYSQAQTVSILNKAYQAQLELEKARVSGAIDKATYTKGRENVQKIYDYAWNGNHKGATIEYTRYGDVVWHGDHFGKELENFSARYYSLNDEQKSQFLSAVSDSHDSSYYLGLALEARKQGENNLAGFYTLVSDQKDILSVINGESSPKDVSTTYAKGVLNEYQAYIEACQQQNSECNLTGDNAYKP